MSERYWITGVQLGILIAAPNVKDREKQAKEIMDKQFLGYYTKDFEQKEGKKG